MCVCVCVCVFDLYFKLFKSSSIERDVNIRTGKAGLLVDQLMYFGSHISSTESDLNIHIGKVLTAINGKLNIWETDLSNKRKQNFFQVIALSILLYGCNTRTITKRLKKKLDEKYTRMLVLFWTNPGSSTLKTGAVRPLTSYLINHTNKTNKTYCHRWRRFPMDSYT